MVEKPKRRIIFCDMWKLCEIHISVWVSEVFWNAATPVHLRIVRGCFPSERGWTHQPMLNILGVALTVLGNPNASYEWSHAAFVFSSLSVTTSSFIRFAARVKISFLFWDRILLSHRVAIPPFVYPFFSRGTLGLSSSALHVVGAPLTSLNKSM